MFFYCDSDSIKKFFDEINERFLYQKVVVVGGGEELKSYYNQNRKSLNVSVLFYANLSCFDCGEEVAMIVCANKKMIDECKSFCYQTNRFLALFITDYIPLSTFLHSKNMASILGVCASFNSLNQNLDNFKINLALDASTVLFDETENLINDLFFNKKFNFEQENLDFSAFLTNISGTYSQTLNQYVALINYFENRKVTVIDTISQQAKSNSNYYKLVAVEAVFNIYKLFLLRITSQLKRVMNSEDICLPTASFQTYFSFEKQFDENKFWFVKNKFGLRIISELDKQLSKLEQLKKICFLINVDKMYDIITNESFDSLKSSIKNAGFKFGGNSFLRLVNHFGYLDF